MRRLWLIPFLLLATMNAGGYRYGASDQAFYIPAILHHVDPSLYPRDWSLLAPQDALNLFTPLAALAVRVTGMPLPHLFLAFYLAGLAGLGAAALGLGARFSRLQWTPVALLFALTLRHAVALGAVNTLEGYLHPRTLAFALGALALVAFLRARSTTSLVLVGLAGLTHPTTAIWFALWIATALLVAEPRWRRPLAAGGVLATAAGTWALALGPLSGRLTVMDAAWLNALHAKTYLFPDRWPAWAWLSVAPYVIVLGGVYARRRQLGLADRRETGLVVGSAVLLGAFLAAVPLISARIAFVVQLQVPRVLWMLDLLAVAYLVWFLAEGQAGPLAGRPSVPAAGHRRALVVALVLVAASVGRGAWVSLVEHPERRLIESGLSDTDWNRALGWVASRSPVDAHVLAHPGHAWRYGTSVRIGARRDVFLEEAKDGALALYSREAAMRFLDRVQALQGFEDLNAEQLGTLAARFGLDLLVAEQPLNLPPLFQSGRFTVYSLE